MNPELQKLEDEQIKLLLKEYQVPVPVPYNRQRALELLEGKCSDCEKIPSKLKVVYKSSNKITSSYSIQKSATPSEPCLPCQQKMK